MQRAFTVILNILIILVTLKDQIKAQNVGMPIG